jgi:hypothetical protein
MKKNNLLSWCLPMVLSLSLVACSSLLGTPAPTPTLVPESMVRFTVSGNPGETKCMDLRSEFEEPFEEELVRHAMGDAFWVWYSMEQHYSNWPPGSGLVPGRGRCIEIDERTPSGAYDVYYDVTIYEEEGMIADAKTRKFLTEGTAVLRLVVTD